MIKLVAIGDNMHSNNNQVVKTLITMKETHLSFLEDKVVRTVFLAFLSSSLVVEELEGLVMEINVAQEVLLEVTSRLNCLLPY